ncbi:hypothetical protein Igni_0141 [Ignicoccus hospitalis KIN4/I]|uniref:Uncharacterized protein n=1 Tax=Ignicoccus hospitalis (strain KIN4/I / DSM 18386 / JCM 14125) TaxID=453591 RepID=A8A8S3_IGNH4|nr:hypothetical protein Igni_0141 [Ignicoccus hospitalis KIN4/I]
MAGRSAAGLYMASGVVLLHTGCLKVAVASLPGSAQTSSTVRFAPAPPKKSVLIMGTFEPKYKLINSLYVALTKLEELDMVSSAGMIDNNVFSVPGDEAPYAKIMFTIGKKTKEYWLVGVPSEISTKILSNLKDSIRAFRGSLPKETIYEIVDDPEGLAKIMGGVKRIVYVFDPETQAYASIELANMLAAFEGRKAEKVAVVNVGKGMPAFVPSTLQALERLGFVKDSLVLETPTLNSFEMLKLAKFVFL